MKTMLPLLTLLLLAPAWAQSAADQVAVKDAMVRQVPPGTTITGAFMVLHNQGRKDVELVKAESTVAKSTELHNHINDGGVMRMRPVKAIPIKAGGEAALKPGGYHVMLIGLNASLKEGETVNITLGFADGSSKVVEARVQKPMMADHGKHHHKH